MDQKKKRKILKIIISILCFFVILALFLEICEKKHSFLKSWLYEKNTTHQLTVATVVMRADKNPEINLIKIANFIRTIKKARPDIDLIFFGETILGWYYSRSYQYQKEIAQPIPGTATNRIAALAKENNVNISFGMAEKTAKKPYNSQVTINNRGEIINVQRKKYDHSGQFLSGPEPISVITIKGITIAIVICADFRMADTEEKARDSKVDLILVSNADFTDTFDTQYFGVRFMAKKFSTWMISANRLGQEHATYWDGHIEILNPFGDMIMSAKGQEQFLVHTLKFNKNLTGAQSFFKNIYTKLTAGYLLLKNLGTALSYL